MNFTKKVVATVLFFDAIIFCVTGMVLMFTDIMLDMRALTVVMLFALVMVIGITLDYYLEEEE